MLKCKPFVSAHLFVYGNSADDNISKKGALAGSLFSMD
jgi:hypothetical protein